VAKNLLKSKHQQKRGRGGKLRLSNQSAERKTTRNPSARPPQKTVFDFAVLGVQMAAGFFSNVVITLSQLCKNYLHQSVLNGKESCCMRVRRLDSFS